jgi:hypothetical protein
MDDDFDPDEDWYDDDGEVDDAPPVRCPECRADVPAVADRCPACGYWLTDADRHTKPLWIRATAVVVLVAFLLSLLGFAVGVF